MAARIIAISVARAIAIVALLLSFVGPGSAGDATYPRVAVNPADIVIISGAQDIKIGSEHIRLLDVPEPGTTGVPCRDAFAAGFDAARTLVKMVRSAKTAAVERHGRYHPRGPDPVERFINEVERRYPSRKPAPAAPPARAITAPRPQTQPKTLAYLFVDGQDASAVLRRRIAHWCGWEKR